MLTPAQLRAHRFISSVRGVYKSDEVDSYFEEVLISYEQLFKENSELVKKISLLAERVEEYKNDEDNIKAAILTAQRMADQITKETAEKAEDQLKEASQKLETATEEANARAQQILDAAQSKANDELITAEIRSKQIVGEAQANAQEILNSAQRESVGQLEKVKAQLENERLALEILKRESSAFKEELINKYKQHLDNINNLPGAVSAFADDKAGDSPGGSVQLQPDADENSSILNQVPEEEPEPEASKPEAVFTESSDTDIVTDEETAESIPESGEQLPALQTDNEPESEEDNEEPEPEEDNEEPEDEPIEEPEETQFSEGEAADTTNAAVAGKDENEYPGLYALRQRAMDQQKELFGDGTDFETGENDDFTDVFSSPDAEGKAETMAGGQSPSIDDAAENGSFSDVRQADAYGFKMNLENYTDDEPVAKESVSEKTADKFSTFETVEYDDEDDDDDGDDSSQPRFKGFFKK